MRGKHYPTKVSQEDFHDVGDRGKRMSIDEESKKQKVLVADSNGSEEKESGCTVLREDCSDAERQSGSCSRNRSKVRYLKAG